MLKFSIPLVQAEDPCTDLAVFGFEHEDMFIYDPYLTECGRFECDPTELYGISKEDADQLVQLNRVLATATEAAVNAGCQSVQGALGINSGGVAGAFFSDDDSTRAFSKGVADYLQAELIVAGNAVT